MTWAHVHLAINHLPVVLVPVAAVMLGVAWVRKTIDLTNAGLVVLVIAAVTVGGAYLTGEPAESVIKGLPGVSDPAIEEHEEAALLASVPQRSWQERQILAAASATPRFAGLSRSFCG